VDKARSLGLQLCVRTSPAHARTRIRYERPIYIAIDVNAQAREQVVDDGLRRLSCASGRIRQSELLIRCERRAEVMRNSQRWRASLMTV